jgi:hypothetical protein
MSGISDVSDIGDISPPRVSPRSPAEHSGGDFSPPAVAAASPAVQSIRLPEPEASDVSDTELFTVEEEVVEHTSSPSNDQSVAGAAVATAAAAGTVANSSDSEMEQLVKIRAELMAKLEGDFKLSPEEESSSDSDSEPEG